MCFTANASFAAGVGLIVPGIIAIKRAKSTPMLAFACTPIIFSFHQISEGCLWLALKHPEYSSWYKPALYAYSVIAQPFWPIWVPLIVWLMEPDKAMKKILSWFLLLGGVFSLYMLYCLIYFNISAFAESGHLGFYRDFPALDLIRFLMFVTAIIPPFFSSLRYMKLVAWTDLGSLIISMIFYSNFTTSVWCFFAAILSVLFILVIVNNKQSVSGSSLTLKKSII